LGGYGGCGGWVDGCGVDDGFVGERGGTGYGVDKGFESFVVANLVRMVRTYIIVFALEGMGVRK
jgi:hypothetical protein